MDICQQGRESTLGTLGKKAEESMRRGTEQTLWLQTGCKGCWHEGGTEKQGKNPKRFLKRGQDLCRKKISAYGKGHKTKKKTCCHWEACVLFSKPEKTENTIRARAELSLSLHQSDLTQPLIPLPRWTSDVYPFIYYCSRILTLTMSLDRNWMWMKLYKVDVVSFSRETSEARKKDLLGEMATGMSL